MTLNPFFQQGSPNEQYLIQDLINEHLRMFGVEIYYIPRKFIDTDDIIREVRSSKFDDNFILEAYLNNYDGFGGQGDIMTKFGVSLRDEISLTISRERFEEFISPLLSARISVSQSPLSDPGYDDGGDFYISTRPKEGDLIYFPLGQRLFEIKFVEHENPFYQLGKNYVYELKCELFEYEDEVVDTSIEEVDKVLEDEGQITTLSLASSGETAAAAAFLGTGLIQKINILNDGYGYTTPPTVVIDPPGNSGGVPAQAISKISRGGISQIILTNAGSGYTSTPSILISGGGGQGGKAVAGIVTSGGIRQIEMRNFGSGYFTVPTVTISDPVTAGAAATASINGIGSITSVSITQEGRTYDSSKNPTITISPEIITSIQATGLLAIGVGGTIRTTLVTNVGAGYTQAPTVIVGSGITPSGGTIGIVTAVITASGVVTSLSIVNPGSGYTATPSIVISAPRLTRPASLRANVSSAGTVSSISILDSGVGYSSTPTLSISNSITFKKGLETAKAMAVTNSSGEVESVILTNTGVGYSDTPYPTVSFSSPSLVGVGTFIFNEVVIGQTSGVKARVKEWDKDTKILKVSITSGNFSKGETIVGASSSAKYSVKSYDSNDIYDKYSQNDEIEEEADLIIDFSETNPFGTY